jgi:hypothetical protein
MAFQPDNLVVLVPLVGGPARAQRCRSPVNGCWWQDLARFLPCELVRGMLALMLAQSELGVG